MTRLVPYKNLRTRGPSSYQKADVVLRSPAYGRQAPAELIDETYAGFRLRNRVMRQPSEA